MEFESVEEEVSCDQNGEEAILTKIRELFGDEIAQAFKDEEINSPSAIQDLLRRESDAPIFAKLGLSYGKAVKFKTELVKQGCSATFNKSIIKPTMALLSLHKADTKSNYLKKRKRVGVLAAKKWGSELPKFNTPDKKAELEEFAKEISSEVMMPEVGFGIEGIMQHTKDFFSEQRKQRKKCKSSSSEDDIGSSQQPKARTSGIQKGNSGPTTPKAKQSSLVYDLECSQTPKATNSSCSENELECSQTPKAGKSRHQAKFQKITPDLPIFPTYAANGTIDHDEDKESTSTADTEILSDDEQEVRVPAETMPQRAAKLIIKLVCGSVPLDREEIRLILTDKFSLSKRDLTDVNYSELLEILAKKLLKKKYAQIKGDVALANVLRSDIKVKKEIQL